MFCVKVSSLYIYEEVLVLGYNVCHFLYDLGDELSKMFYLNLRITNKLTVSATGGIERMNGMKEPFILKPSESLFFRHKLYANRLPYIKVCNTNMDR